jgi:hypothetical protein
VTIPNADPDNCFPDIVPKALLAEEATAYSEMNVASLKTVPSSVTSWSPILSFRDSLVFCGEYWGVLIAEDNR